MEEDLKVLEKFINRCKECKFATCEQCEINWKQVQAIENLIKRNKELEEENKKYLVQLTDEQYRKLVNIIREEKQKEISEYWKSKVREKIEKLLEHKENINEKFDKAFYNLTDIIEFEIKVLEELLQEGDK